MTMLMINLRKEAENALVFLILLTSMAFCYFDTALLTEKAKSF
jgi:hypothetical protein